MSKTLSVVMAMAIMTTILVSCAKKDTAPNAPDPVDNNPQLVTSPNYFAVSVFIGTSDPGGCILLPNTVWGYLTSTDLLQNLNTGSGFDTGSAQIGFALFSGATTGKFVYAGKITCNSEAVDTLGVDSGSPDTVAYYEIDWTNPAFTFHNGVNWAVAGGNGIPAFSHDIPAPYPHYNNLLPILITRANGFSLPLGAAYLSGADSVIVIINDSTKQLFKKAAVSAGSVSFSAAELSGLPAVTDDSGLGILTACFYKTVLYTVGNKQFAFVKQYQLNGSIGVN